MKYTIEMFCCDSCHARATNNDVMNGILGYKTAEKWISVKEDGKSSHFCSEKCWKDMETVNKTK